jgi:hypothetical protein
MFTRNHQRNPVGRLAALTLALVLAISNEAYCLAETGKQYAVYFPNGGQVKLDLSAAMGTLQLRWLDIARNAWQEPRTVDGGGTLELNTPGKGHWAALVLAEGTAKVARWDIYEIALSGPAEGNPFAEVELAARFSQGGRVLDIPGFYDGDGIYRIRFMPDALGQWRYSTRSNRPELDGHTGTMTCVPPGPGNHGPVRVHDRYHWVHADGTPYYLLGTTIYNWVHRDEPLQERTLATLRAHRFNKVRFCIPPKSYAYRHPEPAFHPWPRQGNAFDRTRFDPRFFRNFERRLGDLKEMGIVAELILFHIYDRWGHRAMSPEQDEAYLRYTIARLAAFRNVWWTLANEYELFRNVDIEKDWDHIGRRVQRLDPYDRPRSNHNHTYWYDASKPWVTYANLHYGRPDDHPPDTLYSLIIKAREQFGKPAVMEEYRYEGDLPDRWGNLSPEVAVRAHWAIALAGDYASHGETYRNETNDIFWSAGGELIGKSPARLAFLRKIKEQSPYTQMAPDPELAPGAYVLAKTGQYYLIYFPRAEETVIRIPYGPPMKAEAIDAWQMTVAPIDLPPAGEFRFTPPRPDFLLRLTR